MPATEHAGDISRRAIEKSANPQSELAEKTRHALVYGATNDCCRVMKPPSGLDFLRNVVRAGWRLTRIKRSPRAQHVYTTRKNGRNTTTGALNRRLNGGSSVKNNWRTHDPATGSRANDLKNTSKYQVAGNSKKRHIIKNISSAHKRERERGNFRAIVSQIGSVHGSEYPVRKALSLAQKHARAPIFPVGVSRAVRRKRTTPGRFPRVDSSAPLEGRALF